MDEEIEKEVATAWESAPDTVVRTNKMRGDGKLYEVCQYTNGDPIVIRAFSNPDRADSFEFDFARQLRARAVLSRLRELGWGPLNKEEGR